MSDNTLMGSYVNETSLYTALRAMVSKNTPAEVVDIEFANYLDSSLSITESEANTWMVISAVIIPAVILISGIVIYYKRRHR